MGGWRDSDSCRCETRASGEIGVGIMYKVLQEERGIKKV